MREARWLALRIPPLPREPKEFLRILEVMALARFSRGLPALHSGLGLGSAGSGWLRLACFLRFRMDFGWISVGFRLRLELASAGFGLIWFDLALVWAGFGLILASYLLSIVHYCLA